MMMKMANQSLTPKLTVEQMMEVPVEQMMEVMKMK
jgi:hypothetical protein